MKALSFFKKHRAITIVFICLVMAVAATLTTFALTGNKPKESIKPEKQSAKVQEPVKVEEPRQDIQPVTQNQETTQEITPQAAPVAEPQPTILSTQQYAEMYLDLSGRNQSCFDIMVAKWPDRFTESVREQNIKALAIYAGVCATGIDQSDRFSGRCVGHICRHYGLNGEFFDSEFAKNAAARM